MDYDKKIKELKEQQQIVKDLFLKCQGAIELLESMKKENDKKK